MYERALGKDTDYTNHTLKTFMVLGNKEEPQISSLQKGHPQTQQSKQNEKAEKYSAGKGT